MLSCPRNSLRDAELPMTNHSLTSALVDQDLDESHPLSNEEHEWELILANLALSPEQRIAQLDRQLEMALLLRQAVERAS